MLQRPQPTHCQAESCGEPGCGAAIDQESGPIGQDSLGELVGVVSIRKSPNLYLADLAATAAPVNVVRDHSWGCGWMVLKPLPSLAIGLDAKFGGSGHGLTILRRPRPTVRWAGRAIAGDYKRASTLLSDGFNLVSGRSRTKHVPTPGSVLSSVSLPWLASARMRLE